MSQFTVGSPAFTWNISSKARPGLETPPWSKTGFKTRVFDCEISTPENGRSMAYAYYAPPDYVDRGVTELGEDDHRFVLGSFFGDVTYGSLTWDEFREVSGYQGPDDYQVYDVISSISKQALQAFRFPASYFNEIMEELAEGEIQPAEIQARKNSPFHEIRKEE